MECGHVGILTVNLHLPEGSSLKTKRKELLRLRNALERRCSCVVAEVDHHDLWQRAGLTLTLVSRMAGEVTERLDHASRMLHADEAFRVVGETRTLVPVSDDPEITWEM